MFQAIEGVGTDLVFRDRTAAPTVLIGPHDGSRA